MAATRRLLERLPANRLDWRPHAKSMSLGQLATHVTELPRWGVRIEKPDWTIGSEKAPPLSSASEFVARFDENVARSREAVTAMNDEDLRQRFEVKRNGETFFEMSRASLLRRVLLNHLIHHRGQLSVYLRMNDVPLPSLYGPTADEP